ncbi:MAG: hypothetical protein HY692_00795 [Cyanobacteria bacterium NC_groundwater_1444_Ag_S-0.65um_54_12]|nr:hypothetical protein [Cyanobacteria bacterium NC_groundwater_1444_Ag_S-0.65um_54_12]
MLEYFSARAIEAIQLAQEEARRLEFSQINSAHLVLGLSAEGNGVAARALRAVGFDLRRGRATAERRWGRGYERTETIIPAPEAKEIFEAAMAIAEQTAPLLVDTQDLLRAILAQLQGRGVELLLEAGISPEELLRQLMSERNQDLAGLVPACTEPVTPPKHFHPRLLSSLAGQVLEKAKELTREFGHSIVGTEQVLISLLTMEDGTASRILRQNGLNRLEVEAIAHRVIGRGSGCLAIPVNSRWVNKTLEGAWQTARRFGHEQIGTLHLLLGLLQLDAGGALHLMDLLKVNLSAIQLDAEQYFAESSPRAWG